MRGAALRDHYAARDLFLAKEELLKLLCVLVCAASAAVALSGAGAGGGEWGACSAAPGLVALASGAAVALLYAGALLSAPLLAPTLWFYTELVVCVLVGALLLVSALLGAALCAPAQGAALHYLPAALALAGAGAAAASGALAHAAAARRWEAAHAHAPRPSTAELDV